MSTEAMSARSMIWLYLRTLLAGVRYEVTQRTPDPSAVDRAVLLADEWDSIADRCEKKNARPCTTCVSRRLHAKQLRARLGVAR
jgi:hypothetical protein